MPWHDPVAMRAALLSIAMLAACPKNSDLDSTNPGPPRVETNPEKATGPGDRDAGPLDCTAKPCPTFAEEVARQCSYGGTKVLRATLGRFTVLHAETDRMSIVYTSSEYYFDHDGKLVGRKIFVNEYSRFIEEGVIPTGTWVRESDPCPGKP